MKNVLVNGLVMAGLSLVGATVSALTKEAVNRNQVSISSMKDLERRLKVFLYDNEELIRRELEVDVDDALPNLFVDETVYIRDHKLHKVLSENNISPTEEEGKKIISRFTHKERYNVCIYLPAVISLYGTGTAAYEYVCRSYIYYVVDILNSRNDGVLSISGMEAEAKRIYELCKPC